MNSNPDPSGGNWVMGHVGRWSTAVRQPRRRSVAVLPNLPAPLIPVLPKRRGSLRWFLFNVKADHGIHHLPVRQSRSLK